MNVDRHLKRAAQECADKIGNSDVFICLFNEHMVEEVIPLIQMGLAIYLDKPIHLLIPESRLNEVSGNLRRLARWKRP